MMLREFKPEDISSIVKHGNNPNVSKYLTSRFPSPYRLQDAEWWVNVGSKNGLNLAIDVDGECIGAIGIAYGDFEHEYSSQIGYWLGEAFWGRGFASQALSQMTRDVFSEGKIRRLEARVFGPNTASMKVLEKCGYQLEGIFRQSAYKHGQFFDEHIYARILPLERD